MKQQNISYLNVGIFVLAMLLGLMVMLVMITGFVWSADYYTVRYDNVNGLSRGAPVTFEGFQIGRVSTVEPTHEDGVTSYLVELEIDSSVANGSWPIPTNSRFLLLSSGLLSTITVDIEQGDSKSYLEPNSDHIIQGGKKRDLMETLSSLGNEIEGYKEEFREIIKLVKSGATTLDKGMAGIMDDVSSLTGQMKDGVQDMRKILSAANSKSVGNIITSVEKGAANFEQISRQLKGSQSKLNQVLDESRELVRENRPGVRQAVSDLQASIQVLSRHIGAITHNLDLMSRNMAEFSRQIRENPGLLLREPEPREAAP
jgi:phospholipid/cholesterol/gamma-HCH transport system substrate-binding protein